MKRVLLIATSNLGKAKEIMYGLESLPFLEIKTLHDIDMPIDPPEEDQDSLHGNAYLKAKYYAEKTGYLSLADDAGLFVNGLDGWPGEYSGRIAETGKKRVELVLEKMKSLSDRSAVFRSELVLYDPIKKSSVSVLGEAKGIITESFSDIVDNKLEYSSIFYIPEAGKTFAQMDIREKLSLSHRGKCIQEMKYILQNSLGTKHIVVPVGLIIRDRKILMCVRNDPHNKEIHGKWEFPGGGVEYGESIEQNVVREVKEETGFEVEPVKQLSHIFVKSKQTETYEYQVYLIPFVCRVTGGSESHETNENLGSKWFDLMDVLEQDLILDNKETYKKILPELETVINTHNL